MKWLIIPLLFVVFSMTVMAQEGHMVLLAARETADGGYAGSTADLFLEIQPGKGRVFLETFPLTKVDTQIATRSAKEIACNTLDLDCSEFDFIFTIKAKSSIIGGPSAGAATALLTTSLLTGITLNEDVAITGTINSYGLIGPVGGLQPKIKAAAEYGITKVLVPQRFVKEDINSTEIIDLVEFGKELGVEVIEVSDINHAMFHLSGEYISDTEQTIEIEGSYLDTMKFLADDLCQRSQKLLNDTVDFKGDVREEAYNLTFRGLEAYKNQDYYSSASFCFGSNVKYLTVLFQNKIPRPKEYYDMIKHIQQSLKELDSEIEEREIKTLTDLESYMAVKERVSETNNFLNNSKEAETDEERYYNLAYANERLYSAFSWFEFFDHRGRKFNMNPTILRDSCQRILLEVEERAQYLQIYFPDHEIDISKDFTDAYEDLEEQRYALCLFKASKAKAEINVPLNSLGVTEEGLDEHVQRKLNIAKTNIAMQSSKGIFPILGFSYYEYATNLAETDKFSSLLYSEYALELSNLDVYFQERERAPLFLDVDLATSAAFLVVFLIGLSAGYLIYAIKNPSRPRRLLGKKR
ncbi:S16 family serine protease [Nanoarchaeota archaeon]